MLGTWLDAGDIKIHLHGAYSLMEGIKDTNSKISLCALKEEKVHYHD